MIALTKSRCRIAFPKGRDHADCVTACNYSRDLRPAKWGSGSSCTAAMVRRECPLWVVVSSGRRNTLSQTQEMEWTAMGRRYVRGFNAVAKEELWNRWRCAFAAQPSGLVTQ